MMPSRKSSVIEWAQYYIERGWQVVPLEPGKKSPELKDWLNLVFKAEDFNEKDNIGLRSVNGLTIIDEDCPEAVAVADAFLPPTGAIYGRDSKPKSKRLYRSKFDKTIAFKDLEDGSTLIEIRAGHQDMVPPSIHPDGEQLFWYQLETVGEAENTVLVRAVRLIATTALIARYYNPPGARHDWMLALAGTLRGLGLTEDEAIRVVSESSSLAGDAKREDRLTEVRSTYNRADDEPTKGAKSLKDYTSIASFTKSLGKIWGGSTSAFLMNEKGDKILANSVENIRRALIKLDAHLSYDQFGQKVVMKWEGYHGVLNDNIAMRLWFEIDKRYHFRPTKEFYFDVLNDLAFQHPFHPVQIYLKSLTWDGTPRLDTWLVSAAGAADSPYSRAISALVLIAAVRRIFHPGAKFDEMLVLESGKQGLMKSTALRLLCPNEEWFSDDLPLNVDAKQIVERTMGKWIIEASELSAMSRTNIEHLKGMLSRQVDGPVRLAYARTAVEQRRQFIIIGTTNDHQYLSDSTGNRRFWPVNIERFDLAWIRENRDQLWAEALVREHAGESIRLHPKLYAYAELQQERRRTGDPWEDILDLQIGDDDYARYTPDEIWMMLGIPVDRRDIRAANRVARIMQMLRFRKMTVADKLNGGKRVKGWGRGSKLLEPFLEEPNEELS